MADALDALNNYPSGTFFDADAIRELQHRDADDGDQPGSEGS